MKQYSHDYTKPSEVDSLLYSATRLMANECYDAAVERINEARQLLQEYLAQDNMVEDNMGKRTRMKHHCIFEINKETKEHKFVDDYGEDYTAADEMCQSMNNFRTPDMPVYFCVRCLEQEEFDDIENYDPILTTIVITK